MKTVQERFEEEQKYLKSLKRYYLFLDIIAALSTIGAVACILLALTGCVQHSPGAKQSTTINVSIMPPNMVPL